MEAAHTERMRNWDKRRICLPLDARSTDERGGSFSPAPPVSPLCPVWVSPFSLPALIMGFFLPHLPGAYSWLGLACNQDLKLVGAARV